MLCWVDLIIWLRNRWVLVITWKEARGLGELEYHLENAREFSGWICHLGEKVAWENARGSETRYVVLENARGSVTEFGI